MNDSKILVLNLENTVLNGAPVFTQSARNEDVPLHAHTYIEFFYVFDGHGEEELNGEKRHLVRGDGCLLLLDDRHKFYETKNDVFFRRDILISTSFFKEACDFFSLSLYEDISNGKYSREITLSSEDISSIENYVPSLFLDPNSKEYFLAAKLITASLINLVVSYNFKKASPNVPEWLSNLATRLSTYDNFKYELSELIKDLAYTPDYIRRMFKKYFGMTMTDFFNKQKINYAYFLLKKTDTSIEEICESIGFDNISYFYKLFKNIMHVTPNRIRKENNPNR